MGFTQLDFYPSIAAPFLQKLAHKCFIEKYSVDRIIGRLLCEEITLGRNTAVAVMQGKCGWAWFLSSEEHCRPLGLSFSMQCPNCGRLKDIRILRPSEFDVILVCRACKYQKTLEVPRNNFYTREVLQRQDGWGVQILWGELPEKFFNGKAAICMDDAEDEIKAARLNARLAEEAQIKKIGEDMQAAGEEVEGIAGEEDMVITVGSD